MWIYLAILLLVSFLYFILAKMVYLSIYKTSCHRMYNNVGKWKESNTVDEEMQHLYCLSCLQGTGDTTFWLNL